MIFSTLGPDWNHSPSNPAREVVFHREIEEKTSKLQLSNWLSLHRDWFREFIFFQYLNKTSLYTTSVWTGTVLHSHHSLGWRSVYGWILSSLELICLGSVYFLYGSAAWMDDKEVIPLELLCIFLEKTQYWLQENSWQRRFSSFSS